MFARIVEFSATSEAAAEFVQVVHEKVLPRIKAQPGCIDATVELPQGFPVVLGFSLWKSRSDADRYQQECYPDIAEMLAPYLMHKPVVRTIEMAERGNIRRCVPRSRPAY